MAKKPAPKKAEPAPPPPPPPPPPKQNAGRYKITRQPRTGEGDQPQEAPKPSRYVWKPGDMGVE